MVSVIFILLLLSNPILSQENIFKKFWSLPCPEKKWVIFHPFIAKKAYDVSHEAKEVSENMINDRQMDGDKNGGQVDAFRHAYWMARLAQEIAWRKARSLGKAHEKGNKIYYKRNKMEDGCIPDAISCKMDLLNNEIGIKIGQANKNSDVENLIFIIRSEILKGNLWIIRKDIKGNFINEKGEVLDVDKYRGKWETNKCIVNSNYLSK